MNTSSARAWPTTHVESSPFVRTELPKRSNESVAFERILIFLTVFIVPFENDIPLVGRFSAPFVLFAIMGAYIFVFRLTALRRVISSGPFVLVTLFLLVAALTESFHQDSNFLAIGRTAQTAAGGVLLASLCRDARALRALMWGCILSGTLASWVLIRDGYSLLSSFGASDFISANQARLAFQEAATIEENFNTLSRVAALGAALGLLLALRRGGGRLRMVAITGTVICLIGLFLPMSRGGMISGAFLIAIVLYYSPVTLGKKAFVVIALTVVVMTLVPRVVFQRAQVVTAGRYADTRLMMYTAAVSNFPEYVGTGVGAGNFSRWGMKAGFPSRERAIWVHNSFLQVFINWGIIPLFLYGCVFWFAFRTIPKNKNRDIHITGMLVLLVSLIMTLAFSHVLWTKYMAIALGAVVGLSRWARPFRVRQADWTHLNMKRHAK
jgi:hypothetical protein